MKKLIPCMLGSLMVLVAVPLAAGYQFETPVEFFTICYEGDSPGCHCFDNHDSWDPASGLPPGSQYIQDVAHRTVGTAVSCKDNGGQPYYQMQLGCNSPEDAQWTASMIAPNRGAVSAGSLPLIFFREREWWCSETISYWHRETQIPYSGGFRDNVLQFSWQIPGSGSIRTFYEAQEKLSSGRGLWISHKALDYGNPVLGETIPVPGAYIRIAKWSAKVGDFVDEGKTGHSMMIDEMTIYQTVAGRIVRIEASILEGNVSIPTSSWPGIKAGRTISDLFSVTPAGAGYLPGDKKIDGFGIDQTVDASGKRVPIYDPSRLTYVTVSGDVPSPPVFDLGTGDPGASDLDLTWVPDTEVEPDPLVQDLIDYGTLVDAAGGVAVSATGPISGLDSIPDGLGSQWTIPAMLSEPVDIMIDLIGVHPLPIFGIDLTWIGQPPGTGYMVYWAGADRQFQFAVPPVITETSAVFDMLPMAPSTWPDGVAMPFAFGVGGASVRYVMISIPAGQEQTLVLDEINFFYDWGPDDDAAFNPVGAVEGIVVLESQAVVAVASAAAQATASAASSASAAASASSSASSSSSTSASSSATTGGFPAWQLYGAGPEGVLLTILSPDGRALPYGYDPWPEPDPMPLDGALLILDSAAPASAAGDLICLSFAFADPLGLPPTVDPMPVLDVVPTGGGPDDAVMTVDLVPFDTATATYNICINAQDLGPGVYDLRIGTESDARLWEIRIEVASGSAAASSSVSFGTGDLPDVTTPEIGMAPVLDLCYGKTVGPLLETNWGQHAPYNKYVPGILNLDTGTVANERLGCWSVAIAQIMHHHGLHPYGHQTYQGNLYEVDVEFDHDFADHELIVDDLSEPHTSAEEDETALYCFYAAAVTRANFGAASIGAPAYIGNSDIRRDEWEDHYGVVTERKRIDDYTDNTSGPHTREEIEQFIMTEIDADCPLLFFMDPHAVVIDGYCDGAVEFLVHVNFGWATEEVNAWYPLWIETYDPWHEVYGSTTEIPVNVHDPGVTILESLPFTSVSRWVCAIRPWIPVE